MKRILSIFMLLVALTPCFMGVMDGAAPVMSPVAVVRADTPAPAESKDPGAPGANKIFNVTGDGSGGITISGANFPSMTGEPNIVKLATGPLDKYKNLATIITGFATVTAFLSMIICFTKLSAAGDNEQARKKAIAGILTSGIGVALLGSATIIIGFFWKLFKT